MPNILKSSQLLPEPQRYLPMRSCCTTRTSSPTCPPSGRRRSGCRPQRTHTKRRRTAARRHKRRRWRRTHRSRHKRRGEWGALLWGGGCLYGPLERIITWRYRLYVHQVWKQRVQFCSMWGTFSDNMGLSQRFHADVTELANMRIISSNVGPTILKCP